MIDDTPARRFLLAAKSVVARAGVPDGYPEFLDRLGLRGLFARITDDSRLAVDPAAAEAARARDSRLLEHAAAISGELTRTGVRHCVAKGVALVGAAYQPGDRVLGNVDVYVPAGDRETAARVMDAMGFAALPEREQTGPATLRSAVAMRPRTAAREDGITVDLRWGIDPVERLMPRRTRPVPERIWEAVTEERGLRVPAPEHHAAVLVHRLVHTDLLHVRSLLDVAFLFQRFAPDGGAEYLVTCRELRIGRFAKAVARIVANDLGVARPATLVDEPVGWDPFVMTLDLERWLALVRDASPKDEQRITARRIRRRLKLLDAGGAHCIAQDILLPPVAFLRWRWPDKSPTRARLIHYRQLARKAIET